MQTKSIEKQLQRISEVLLPLPDETQPTRFSLAVVLLAIVFWASARVEKARTTVVDGMSDIIIGDELKKLQ